MPVPATALDNRVRFTQEADMFDEGGGRYGAVINEISIELE